MTIKNRQEIVFLYDVTNANPNGDPDEGNQPRMDPYGYNIVTDVRLKRTIRDYIIDHKTEDGMRILVKKVLNKDKQVLSMGDLIMAELGLKKPPSSAKEKAKARNDILEKIPITFFDARVFGASITLKGANVSMVGPTQFGIGKSLNKPRIESQTITTTFASTSADGEDSKGAGTFGVTHYVDYSLIGFNGIISETSAKHTNMTENDAEVVFDALWNGTKNLNTRSKFNHSPRLLMVVVSEEKEFQIGGLTQYLELDGKLTQINEFSKVLINLDKIIERLNEFKKSIKSIKLREDTAINYQLNGKSISVQKALSDNGFTVEEI